MNFLLDKKRAHEADCEAAIQAGDNRKAIFHAAKAAEFAYALAEQTAPAIAARYIEDAEGWLEIAERIRANPPALLDERQKRKTKVPSDEDRTAPAESWIIREKPDVAFDDIIGLHDLKSRVGRFIVKFKNPDEVSKWKGARLGDRMILYGPPGNGKTLFARAVAREIDAVFFLVKGSNVLDKWVGESQKNVARLFNAVRGSERAVVFLDEIDGILSKRGSSSTVRDSVVSEFLQEMEGLSSPNQRVLFIGATNLPGELDNAVVSRFGAMFHVPLPDREMRLALLKKGFSNFAYGCAADVSPEAVAERLEGHSMRSVQRLVDDLVDIGILESASAGKPHVITNADIETALRSLPPPLDKRTLKKYEAFSSQ